jgi:hypothetical protein
MKVLADLPVVFLANTAPLDHDAEIAVNQIRNPRWDRRCAASEASAVVSSGEQA